jgi:hypothetical protein
MALPVLADLKSYCRIQTTAEDTMLAGLLGRATAMVEGVLGRPITAAERTDVVTLECPATRFTLPVWPVATATLVLTDPNDDAVVEADYTVSMNGLVRASAGVTFAAGDYEATYDAGWSAHPDYGTKYEPILASAILDVAADLYQRRNPAATQETSGGGISVTYDKSGLPMRVMSTLRSMLPMEIR